jgi:hypothetical protein
MRYPSSHFFPYIFFVNKQSLRFAESGISNAYQKEARVSSWNPEPTKIIDKNEKFGAFSLSEFVGKEKKILVESCKTHASPYKAPKYSIFFSYTFSGTKRNKKNKKKVRSRWENCRLKKTQIGT